MFISTFGDVLTAGELAVFTDSDLPVALVDVALVVVACAGENACAAFVVTGTAPRTSNGPASVHIRVKFIEHRLPGTA